MKMVAGYEGFEGIGSLDYEWERLLQIDTCILTEAPILQMLCGHFL